MPLVRTSLKIVFILAFWLAFAAAYFNLFPIPNALTHVTELGCLALIVAAAGGFGYATLRWIQIPTLTGLETLVFSATIGFGELAFLMSMAGVIGGWTRLGAWVLITLGLLVSAPLLRAAPAFFARKEEPSSERVMPLVPFLAIKTAGVLSLILAFAPVTYYDSLVYHLALPAVYVQAHHWVRRAELIYSAFPQNMEMLWTLGLLVKNDIVANLVNWTLSILTIGAVFSFGKRYLDERAAWMAAALLAVMPAFLLLSSGGYVEAGLTLFSFLSLYALCLWRNNPRRATLCIAGLLAGWALGIKYTAGIPVGIGALLILKESYRKPGKQLFLNLVCYTAPALAVFSPWLAKNFVFVGNPVFPFFYQWGSKTLNPWVSQAAAGYFAGVAEYRSHSFLELVQVMWDLAIKGIDFGGGMDVLGDFGWAPLIGLLPCLWLCRKISPTVRLLLIYAVLYFIPWGMSRPVLRFLMPLAPVLALLAAHGWVHGFRSQRGAVLWAGRGFLSLLVLSGIFLFFFVTHIIAPFPAALGLEEKDAYLTRKINYYGAASFINEQMPDRMLVYVLGDQRGYYYQKPVLVTPVFNRNPLADWANEAATPDELLRKLKDKGITHVLVNRAELARLAPYHIFDLTDAGKKNWDGLESKLAKPIYRDSACEVLEL